MNIFKQFYKSIYSPKDIASFRFQGIGKTILFVFFLTLISILPSIYHFSTLLTTGIEMSKSVIMDELPEFSIENGTLSAESEVPIIIDRSEFSIMIDPTGTLTDKEVEEEGNAFALLKNEFAISTAGVIDKYPYSMLEGLKLTKNDLVDLVDVVEGMKTIIIPVTAIFIFIISSAASFIEVSILALIGLALMNLAGRKTNYRELWRMAAYSETLPTLFFTIMAAIKTTVPNAFLINWFVAIIVLFLAIKEISKPKETIEN